MVVAPSTAGRRTTTLLLVCTAVLSTGIGLVFPLLAEFQSAFGFSTAGLGLISGAAFGSALVSGLLLSGLADRGHCRRLLVAGAVLCAASLAAFALGSELWQLVGARALEGFGLGIFTPAVRRVMTAADPTGAGHQLGRLVSAELIGLLVGPLLGTALASTFSLDTPFVVLAILSGTAAAVLVVLPLPPTPVRSDGSRSVTASLRLMRSPRAFGTALLSLSLFLPVGIYDALFARYLTDRGVSTFLIGLTIALYSVPVILVAPFGGRFADRVGPVRAAGLAMLVIVPLTAIYGLVRWPAVFLVLAVVEGFPEGVANPAVQTAMVHAVDEHDVAAGQGLINSLNQLGGAVVGLAAPWGYATLGPPRLFAVAAAGMAAVFLAGAALVRRTPPGASAG